MTDKAVTTHKKKKETTIYYNEKGKKTGTKVVTLDKYGNVIKEVSKEKNRLRHVYKYTYKKNILVEKVYKNYNEDGKLSSSYDYRYKNDKIESMIHMFYNNGKVTSKEIEKYTYKGKDIYSTFISTVGENSDVTRCEVKLRRDKAENPIYLWQKNYTNDKLVNTITYKNELYTSGAAKGCLKKSTHYRDGKLDEIWTYNVKKIKVKVLKEK